VRGPPPCATRRRSARCFACTRRSSLCRRLSPGRVGLRKRYGCRCGSRAPCCPASPAGPPACGSGLPDLSDDGTRCCWRSELNALERLSLVAWMANPPVGCPGIRTASYERASCGAPIRPADRTKSAAASDDRLRGRSVADLRRRLRRTAIAWSSAIAASTTHPLAASFDAGQPEDRYRGAEYRHRGRGTLGDDPLEVRGISAGAVPTKSILPNGFIACPLPGWRSAK
jgi:hypothetical protein